MYIISQCVSIVYTYSKLNKYTLKCHTTNILFKCYTKYWFIHRSQPYRCSCNLLWILNWLQYILPLLIYSARFASRSAIYMGLEITARTSSMVASTANTVHSSLREIEGAKSGGLRWRKSWVQSGERWMTWQMRWSWIKYQFDKRKTPKGAQVALTAELRRQLIQFNCGGASVNCKWHGAVWLRNFDWD